MLVYVHKNFNTENQEITKTGFQAGPRYQNQKCDWSGLMCVHTRDMCWGALIGNPSLLHKPKSVSGAPHEHVSVLHKSIFVILAFLIWQENTRALQCRVY